jgi:hypothetical protein
VYAACPEWTITTTEGRRLTFRQVGHHGQTGAFYSLDEKPSLTEGGGWGPLWELAWNDPVYEPEVERPGSLARAWRWARLLLGTAR